MASQNVVGALAGEGALAGQWVIIGAHYDHLGSREEDGLTRVFNGADDNASGTAVLMEVGPLLVGWVEAHPEADAARRSIMFHAYGAEEIGLFGSRQYAVTPTVPGDSLYAMINLDMIGRLQDRTLMVIGSGASTAWAGLLETGRPDGIELLYSRIIHQENNIGKLPGAINLGLENARGEYLTWMQDDSFYQKNAIELMVTQLVANPEIGQVYADYWEIDADGVANKILKAREPEEFLKALGDPAGVCFLIRRAVREAVGPHDVTTYPSQDYDYRLRIALQFSSLHIHEATLFLASA